MEAERKREISEQFQKAQISQPMNGQNGYYGQQLAVENGGAGGKTMLFPRRKGRRKNGHECSEMPVCPASK